jgi:hypothetical protein
VGARVGEGGGRGGWNVALHIELSSVRLDCMADYECDRATAAYAFVLFSDPLVPR